MKNNPPAGGSVNPTRISHSILPWSKVLKTGGDSKNIIKVRLLAPKRWVVKTNIPNVKSTQVIRAVSIGMSVRGKNGIRTQGGLYIKSYGFSPLRKAAAPAKNVSRKSTPPGMDGGINLIKITKHTNSIKYFGKDFHGSRKNFPS